MIRRNDRDYSVAVDFNNMKHDISSLRFCGMEKVSQPPRDGDRPQLTFEQMGTLLDFYFTYLALLF